MFIYQVLFTNEFISYYFMRKWKTCSSCTAELQKHLVSFKNAREVREVFAYGLCFSSTSLVSWKDSVFFYNSTMHSAPFFLILWYKRRLSSFTVQDQKCRSLSWTYHCSFSGPCDIWLWNPGCCTADINKGSLSVTSLHWWQTYLCNWWFWKNEPVKWGKVIHSVSHILQLIQPLNN